MKTENTEQILLCFRIMSISFGLMSLFALYLLWSGC